MDLKQAVLVRSFLDFHMVFKTEAKLERPGRNARDSEPSDGEPGGLAVRVIGDPSPGKGCRSFDFALGGPALPALALS